MYLFSICYPSLFFFNDPATTEIYTLSLHDALPIYDDDQADEKMAPYRCTCVHDDVPAPSPTNRNATALPGAAAAATGADGAGAPAGGCGLNNLARTSSRGPMVWTRPLIMARTRSMPASALGRCATTTTMPPRARTPRMAWASALSPSASRLELGSSSTTRKGSL